jgi:hypothetical protein
MKRITLIIGLFVCFAGAAMAQSFDPAQRLITKLNDSGVVVTPDQINSINTLANQTLKAEFPQGGEVKTNSSFSQAVSEFKQSVFKNILTADQRQKFNQDRR